MALSETQKDSIRVHVKVGELSNRAIAKEVGCSESAVRTLIKKEGIIKNAINALAIEDVQNVIKAKEIKTQKSALNNAELNAYNEVYTDLAIAMNVFNNSALQNQSLINTAQNVIERMAKQDEDEALLQLPNLLAISKITESNRKQLLGNTETYKPDTSNDDDIEIVIE